MEPLISGIHEFLDQLKEPMEPLISGIHEFYGSTEGTYGTINIRYS